MADPPQILNAGAQPPVGVANPSQIEFYVGNPPRQMLIFSGVGVSELYSADNNVSSREFVVMLGASTTPNFQYTSTVGLASITCDDSDFNFFANESSVDQDPLTGELRLHAGLIAQADTGSVNRFSYHVQVLSDPIVGSIMGTIRWAAFFGDPSDAVVRGLRPMFSVDAGVNAPDPGGLIPTTKFEPRVTGFSTAIPRNYNGTWVVPYKIENVPLGQTFVVQPHPPGPNLVNAPANYDAQHPSFNPSQRGVLLTPSVPTAAGVDFDMLLRELAH